MRESMPIGPTPYDEPCAQVGDEDYRKRNSGEPVAKHDELRWRQAPPEGMNRIQTWWAPLGSAQERTLYGWHPDNLVDDHNVQCSKLRRYPINEQEGELLCRASFMKYHRDEAEKWDSLPIYEPK